MPCEKSGGKFVLLLEPARYDESSPFQVRKVRRLTQISHQFCIRNDSHPPGESESRLGPFSREGASCNCAVLLRKSETDAFGAGFFLFVCLSFGEEGAFFLYVLRAFNESSCE